MLQFERIPPEQGGNCADDSYLLQRFDPELFGITNKTAYSKEVKAHDHDGFGGHLDLKKSSFFDQDCLKFCVATRVVLESEFSIPCLRGTAVRKYLAYDLTKYGENCDMDTGYLTSKSYVKRHHLGFTERQIEI